MDERSHIMDSDEIDSPRPSIEPKDLQSMSIEELKKYVLSLQHEITRAENTITNKKSHRSGAECLFSIE